MIEYGIYAAMMKSVDIADLKSAGSDTVPVRFRLAAPALSRTYEVRGNAFFFRSIRLTGVRIGGISAARSRFVSGDR